MDETGQLRKVEEILSESIPEIDEDLGLPQHLAELNIKYGEDLIPKEGAPGSASANFAAITLQHMEAMSTTVKDLARLEIHVQNNYLNTRIRHMHDAEHAYKKMKVDT